MITSHRQALLTVGVHVYLKDSAQTKLSPDVHIRASNRIHYRRENSRRTSQLNAG